MTEKLKVTQEQADWLEKYESEEAIDYAIDIQPLKKRPDSPIVDWHASMVARALLIGYEIKPEYKVGDLVIPERDGRTNSSEIYEIIDLDKAHANLKGIIGIFSLSQLRHATPEEIEAEKERRKWARIEEGDVLRHLPWSSRIGIYAGCINDESVLIQISGGQEVWKKTQVELYAKKVGASNA